MTLRPAHVWAGLRLAAALAVATRVARAARPRPPLTPPSGEPEPNETISVVIPARDEERRLGPCLDGLAGAPRVAEVIVVDDRSSDGTAELAGGRGARVVAGQPLPPGWVGKAWALQQGVEAATAPFVVTLDADARPDPALPAAAVARLRAEHLDLLTVAGRFECPTAGARWLHPAMLTTLVYRFGPPGGGGRRVLANGQCMAFRRDRVDLGTVGRHVVEDVALARSVAASGGKVQLVDGTRLLTVRMYESLAATWSGWSRSLALPGVETTFAQVVDATVLALAQGLPWVRLVTGRADRLDLALVAMRLGTLVGTSRAYARRDAAYWLSPLADPAAVAAVIKGTARRSQVWRGRRYATPPERSGAR